MFGQYIFQEAKKILNGGTSSPLILTHLSFKKYQEDYCHSTKKSSTMKINLLEDASTPGSIDLTSDKESHEQHHQDFIDSKLLLFLPFIWILILFPIFLSIYLYFFLKKKSNSLTIN